jgi:periodic tryptophan protein 2
VERQSGMFFNFNYFEECFISGNLDDAENYLSGFTTVDDNSFSTLVFFEIRWHKFILALDQ